jgi:GAF domain-containing protein
VEEDGQHLVVHAAHGAEAEAVGGVRIPVGEGFAGRIAAMWTPLSVGDLATFPVVNPLLRERLQSVVGVPLVADARLLGVLHIGSASLRPFTEDELRLPQLVGERVALVVDHARLEERMRFQASMLERTHDAIFAWKAGGSIVY